jgi:hypothetical protein
VLLFSAWFPFSTRGAVAHVDPALSDPMEIFFKKERGSKEAEKFWSIYPPKQEVLASFNRARHTVASLFS